MGVGAPAGGLLNVSPEVSVGVGGSNVLTVGTGSATGGGVVVPSMPAGGTPGLLLLPPILSGDGNGTNGAVNGNGGGHTLVADQGGGGAQPRPSYNRRTAAPKAELRPRRAPRRLLRRPPRQSSPRKPRGRRTAVRTPRRTLGQRRPRPAPRTPRAEDGGGARLAEPARTADGGGAEKPADNLLPEAAGLATRFQPFDLGRVRQALAGLVGRVAPQGGWLAGLLSRLTAWAPWLAGLAVVGVVYDVRRRRRAARSAGKPQVG